MNTVAVNHEPRPAQLTSRRGTLERQCSIGTHSNPGPLEDVIPESSLSTSYQSRTSFASSRSLSAGQSIEDVFGVSETAQAKASTLTTSNDKSNSANTAQMSKAGRKRKHPMKPGKYICQYCSRPCAKPSVLQKHIRMHTGERPYPCDVCDLSFKTKSNLYKHRKSSTHQQKCKEKGVSMETMYGESFGSSRDESLDLEEEEKTPTLSIPMHKRTSSVGGLTDKKSCPSPNIKQPSYLETLRHLEKVYDVIDDYAAKMGTVVCKHSHWLLDKDCIISIQLRHPPSVLACSNGVVGIASSKSDRSTTTSTDVQQRITNLLKANDEIVNSAGKRRLSRQQSVRSPTSQMFNSELAVNQSQSSPRATADTAAMRQQIGASSYLDSTGKLPDGEELLKHIREIILLNSSIDSNIKLLMHEHVMEVKLKLFIPDVAARRKCMQGLSVDSSIDNQIDTSQGSLWERRFSCEGCNQSFSREHILTIHSSFFCYRLLPESRKKMKLLKTGSEDSYVYLIAESPSKLVNVTNELALQSTSIQQQSSTEVSSESGSTRQQLKKHVLKHMSQGSFNETTPSFSSSNVATSLNKSTEEKASSMQDTSGASTLPAIAVSSETVPVVGGSMTCTSPKVRVQEDTSRITQAQSLNGMHSSFLMASLQPNSSSTPLVISVVPAVATTVTTSAFSLTPISTNLTPAAAAGNQICPAEIHSQQPTSRCGNDSHKLAVTIEGMSTNTSSCIVSGAPTANPKPAEDTLADIIPSTVMRFDCSSPVEEVDHHLPEIRCKVVASSQLSNLNNQPPGITALENRRLVITSPGNLPSVVTIRDNQPYGLANIVPIPPVSSSQSIASFAVTIPQSKSAFASQSGMPPTAPCIDNRPPIASANLTPVTVPASVSYSLNTPLHTNNTAQATVMVQDRPPKVSSAASRLLVHTCADGRLPACSTATSTAATLVNAGNKPAPASLPSDQPFKVIRLDNSTPAHTVLEHNPSEKNGLTVALSGPIGQTVHLPADPTQQALQERMSKSDSHVTATPKVTAIFIASTSVPISWTGPEMATISTTNAMHLCTDNIPLPKPPEPIYVKVVAPQPAQASVSTLPPPKTSLHAAPIAPARKDAERISSLRRRFSKARSKSSVSFEDPPVKQPTHLSVPTIEPPRPPAEEGTSLPAASSVWAEANRPAVIGSILPSTTGISIVPKELKCKVKTNECPQLASLDVGLAPVFCTINRRAATFHAECSHGSSQYLKWKSNGVPFAAGRLDMLLPLSCYSLSHRLIAYGYVTSKMDTRSIFTHSSYWQYKKKMRVMQSMPLQVPTSQVSGVMPVKVLTSQVSGVMPIKGLTSQVSGVMSVQVASSQVSGVLPVQVPISQVSGVVPVQVPTIQVSGTVYTNLSASASTLSLSQTITSVSTSCTNTKLGTSVGNSFSTAVSPSAVVTLQVPSLKKPFQRSQSTPNAGEESQSKLIAGGFKSDEDYVYIRGKGKGKFVCQQCGIRCRKPSMLKKHIRTHTDLRPYNCRHCTFSFKTKGNLTKHMRSKAHHRRCLELHIVPVPLTVEDSQIDRDILASQQRLSRQSKIQGAKLSEQEKQAQEQESSDSSEEDELSDEEEVSEDSSEDDALQIDESSDDADKSVDGAAVKLNMASLRRVQSMPAHHQANSFDASSLAEMLPTELQPHESQDTPLQPPKKRKRNHLNLTINTGDRCTEDDVAMSLLDLSKTPVYGTPTLIKQNSLNRPLLPAVSTKSPLSTDVKRVSVVRSTKGSVDDYSVERDYNEPIDLSIQPKATQFRFICPLCRAICSSQESLDKHMKLHDGPVIEVPHKGTKRLLPSSHSLNSSFDATNGPKSTHSGQPQTPQTPGLRRQQAINMFDSDAEEDDVDHTTKAEPGEMLSEEVVKRKCPYCPKVFHSESSVPMHIKSHHVITQEYVCTYKDCGLKFTNKQDLTYHLGTHALDDNEKYQPISIPKCGICEKTFKSMNSLKQHLQQHSDARPHICEYCDAGFTTSQFLKNHLKTHTQERPYVCRECDSTFARSDHLTQHAKTHNKHSSCDVPSRVAVQVPTILNPAGAQSHHHHAL